MNAPAQSTQLRNAMPDADDEGRKIYMALLERRLLMVGLENLRLRACLERATGTSWDSTNLADPTPEQLDEMVASDMARGLNLAIEDARDLVRRHKAMANPSQVEMPAKESKAIPQMPFNSPPE